jgi:hypothetical protein
MYAQRYVMQQKLPGIGWEGITVAYAHGHSASETVTKVRSQAARWIRYYRNMRRENGVIASGRVYRVVADVPFFSPSIVAACRDYSPSH